MDLSNWDFAKDGPVNLSGEHEFYWQQHLTPESFSRAQPPERSGFIRVPAYWKGHVLNGMKLPGAGYATYRLTVLLKDSSFRELAIKFLDMGTAYTVFANGKKILSVGTAGQTPEATVPRYFPQVVDLALDSNRIELIYQVSNFHHHRGGAWESIRLGTTEQISAMREERLALDLILFGSIVAMGLYHLALFGLRKSDLSSCFFGLFCFLIAIRLLTTVERYLLHIFPMMSWKLFVKVEYLSAYLAVPVFAVFLHHLFSRDFHKPVIAAISAIGLLFSSLVALTPARIFTRTLHAYEFFIVMSVVYAFFMLVLCAVRKREGAAIILFGFIFLSATIVNDILDADIIIQTGHFLHLGLFIFIFSHAFMLSSGYARAFVTIETQRLHLAKAEERFRQLAENIEEVFWLSNLEKDEIIYISSGYEKIWGHTCESLYASSQNWLEAIHPEDRDRVLEAALTKQVSGQYDETYRIQRPDGSIRWIRDRAFPIRDQTGAIYRIAGIAQDITAFKKVEEALRQSEESYRGLIESSPVAIFVEQESKLVYINPAGLRLMGYDAVSEHTGYGLKDLFDKNDECPLEKFSRMKGNGVPIPVIEVKFIRKDGKLIDGEATFINTIYQGKPAIQALARDITETKYLRQKAERMERLAALGQLSTTIAHEIRNPLGSISLNFQYLARRLEIPPPLHKMLCDIEDGMARIKNIIDGILGFARTALPALQKNNIHKVLDSAVNSVKSELEQAGVTIKKSYAALQPEAMMDANQIVQVCINLFLNAKEAMGKGGQLTISTISRESALEVQIEDTGEGISPENLKKIYDPFFTTRTKGIGLGLAVVSRIL
ncbi:MAG: PAS domain S-box protein, partial [bacterium]